MTPLPPIRPIIAFEAAARLGSFKQAADELSVSPSAISHNIAILESFLGRKLFERRTRSLQLTADGYKYSLLIGQVTQTLRWATREIASGPIAETLTIESHPTFAGTWLAPRIRDFSERNPDIDIRLKTSFTPLEALSTGVEVAFTYIEEAPVGCAEKIILNEHIGPFAEPKYWRELEGRSEEEKLQSAVLIHSDRNLIGWQSWLQSNAISHPQVERGPRFDRGQVALDIAASGWGVALESSAFAERYLSEGSLVRLFPTKAMQAFARTHKMITPHAVADLEKVKRFEAFILSSSVHSL